MPDEGQMNTEVRLAIIELKQAQIDEKLKAIDKKLDQLIQEPMQDAKHYKRLIISQIISWGVAVFAIGFACWTKMQM